MHATTRKLEVMPNEWSQTEVVLHTQGPTVLKSFETEGPVLAASGRGRGERQLHDKGEQFPFQIKRRLRGAGSVAGWVKLLPAVLASHVGTSSMLAASLPHPAPC